MADPVVPFEKFRIEADRLTDLERRVASLSSGGGPPYDGGMEKRVAKLEATIPTLATKESMKELGGKIEILAERLSNEIRVMDERLSGKIDASDERLSGKIDTLDARLSGEIGKLDERTKHMPTKFGVASIVTAVMAFFTAVSLFSSQILAALGLGS